MNEKNRFSFRDYLLIVNSALILLLLIVVGYMYIAIFQPFEQEKDLPQPIKSIENSKDLQKNSRFTGNGHAKMTIIDFNSFSCGWCGKFKPVLLRIVKNFPNDVKLVYKHYNRSEKDIKTAMALECAGDQNKFWEMYDSLFNEENGNKINEAAQKIGLNSTDLNKCVASNKYKQKTISDSQEAKDLGIEGTPAFIVNDKLFEGYMTYEIMEKLVKNELAELK